MFIHSSCTACRTQRARSSYRLLSLCSPSTSIRPTQSYLLPLYTPFQHFTRVLTTAIAMPKRKSTPSVPAIVTPAIGANMNVAPNVSVLKDQLDYCFDILDGELAEAASLDSLELSSPPFPDQEAEEAGRFILKPEIALPMTKKKARKGKKASVTSKKKLSNEDEEEPGDGLAESNGNGVAKKATTSKKKPQAKKKKVNEIQDVMESEVEEPEERPPPVNSDYVPIPWKGRLGFACLNTYLRATNPPIFCSRTCRIDTILKHGAEGQKYVESLGLANARDLVKLIHWNERYGIKFLRISSEMFPFASHPVHGYSLEFAKDVLTEAGKAAMKYGHRLSMHPGQFTQFGSPRKEVVENSMKDVNYHAQLLGYLRLTGQADKDAVMILHMGGAFGDKGATLQRFRENYARLSPEVKARLVLENDDMCWSVHDLLPICKDLNIPLVLDWHHHNLIHDPSMREGSLDILQLIPEVKETWTRKGITQKQHYSEPREGVVTHKERRRHSARVMTLPPCEDTMDLMIEAKDKEQAVFNLMRKFRIPGFEKIQDVIPHVRDDENKPELKKKAVKTKKSKKAKKAKKKGAEEDEAEEAEEMEIQVEEEPVPDPEPAVQLLLEEEIGMGGAEGRVYWPEGKAEWLSPKKRVRVKKAEAEEGAMDGTKEDIEASEMKPKRAARKAKKDIAVKAEGGGSGDETVYGEGAVAPQPDEKKPKRTARKPKKNATVKDEVKENGDEMVDGEAATTTPLSKMTKGIKKASVPVVVDENPTRLPNKASRKRKLQVVEKESLESEMALVPAPSTKRKLAVNKESTTVAEVGEVVVPLVITTGLAGVTTGTRRSTRARKAVEYMELGEGDIDGVEAGV